MIWYLFAALGFVVLMMAFFVACLFALGAMGRHDWEPESIDSVEDDDVDL